jgi:hydrogenase nickel incorporation protein HypB
MVQNALEGWDPNKLDFLLIENVGNLVRFLLRYPTIFNSADFAIITKSDLAAAAAGK